MIITLQTLIFFRESIVTVLERLIVPYYKRFSFAFKNNHGNSDEDETEEQVFAEFDDEKGVVFFPPMYVQRYAAVNDCLLDERWRGKLEKIVDLGYHDMSFIKYIKEVPGVKHILGVDMEMVPLQCSSDLVIQGEYTPKPDDPLQISLFQGNAADPDYRLIGCDAVVAIEMIEHMLPHDLERLVHNIFGFIQPHVAVITTPNADFNVLFKAMEKNGLRRWDHLFEWTREQFHDWCSNIVLRYPNYTVTCKGIGPGPPGTLHHGCCSQLALFVAKNYHKQQDLTIESLALVKNLPKENNLSDMEDSWECTDTISESNMICGPSNEDQYPESYTEKHSFMTIVITTTPPPKILEYQDNTVQCNIDTDISRSYLMFDEHVSANVLTPRRQIANRVYDMEDVNNRLNCSTIQVKKFSKATQNLMAKNKTDIIVHTKDIVDDIRQLTKMLNFDKSKVDDKQDSTIWKNINWGEDAPYWNQYYKIVREYNYPFEVKSDECQIIELISDEINRLIDMQSTDDGVTSMENLEIPIEYLMRVVEHITDNKNKVIDLLEWNGYDVVDNFVIYSRPNIENLPMATPEIIWQDDVTVSDWDVKEIHSTSHSNGSAVSSQLYDKDLQQIFDYKVGKLRALLTADEDIIAELDQVVYRLMKLAVKTSRERETLPTATWLQCKLLDLLTLAERALERRKRHYFDKNQLTIQSTDFQESNETDQLELSNAEENTVKKIVDKYCHFIEPSVNTDEFDGFIESYVHIEVEDNISVASNGMVKVFDNDENTSSPARLDRNIHFKSTTRENKSPTSGKWKHDNYSGVSSSGDTDHSFKTDIRSSSRRVHKRCKYEIDKVYHRANIRAKRRRLSCRAYKINENCGVRNDRKRLIKRFIAKKYIRWYLLKNNIKSVKYEHKMGIKKIVRQHRPLKTFIKPVSTINLRQRGVNKDLLYTLKHGLIESDNEVNLNNKDSIAVTEESCILEIVTDGMNETIAFRRTVATDAYDYCLEISEQLSPSSNEMVAEEKAFMPENGESKHIFLFDINEPSTSKGIRHANMDVQCGSDDVLSPVLSPVTSLRRTPGIISSNVNDSYTENVKPCEECLDCNVFGNKVNPVDDNILRYRMKSNGIQIKDSEVELHNDESIPAAINFNQDFKMVFGSKLKNIDVLERVQVSNVMESKKFYSEVVRNSTWEAENEREPFTKSIYEKNNTVSDYISHVNKENNFENNVTFSKTDATKRNLIFGGIFVHSYKDRTTCEDILYQGKWQRSALRLVKTSPHNVGNVRNYSALRATNTKDYSKEIFSQKFIEKTRNKRQKCESYRQTIESEKSKDQNVRSHSKERPIVASTPIKCSDKKLTMASTKKPLSLVMCKSKTNKNNTLREVDKPLVNAIKENKTIANLRKKNIPKCLQSKCKYISKSLEKIVDSMSDAEKIDITSDDLVTSSRTHIKKELLKYICDPSHDVTYSVFRNQIENKKSSDVEGLLAKEMNNSNEEKTTSNFPSTNSSCSSNNSIATIKQLSPHNKDLQSKGKFITKSFIRLKNCKKSSFLRNDSENCKRSTFNFENKENYPESSNSNVNTPKKTQDPVKSIVMASNTVSSARSNLAKNKKNSEDTNLCVSRVSLCKKALLPDAMQNAESDKHTCVKVDPQNQVHIPECNKNELHSENVSTSQSTQAKNIETSLRNKKSAYKSTDVEKIDNDGFNVYDELKSMLEERLNFIENLSVSKRLDSNDNQKIIPEECSESCDKSSPDKSVADDSTSSSWRSGPEPVQVDLISFKSFASISGFTEYYNAENKRNSTIDSLQNMTPPVRSVHDIFERNDQLRVANSVGLMDTQDFSRFSINERMIGDQPDYVNLIDSETGSLAHCMEVRRATSEEVFTSGRSSDTYVSCQVDDESVVPHWLFRMNNRQESDEEQSTTVLSPVPLPAVAPQLDVNGNIPEQGVGVGTGAGDGRGIHSDQDSSGRDTSLSSTDTSSGQQSEALLVDPPGFASNMEFLREPSSRPFLQIPSSGAPNASFRTAEGSENDNIYNISEGPNRNGLNHEIITSDRDADVSSLDTDIADFSDN